MPASIRSVPWWIPVGAVLLALIYAPSLRTKFDFTDDGNLVYPTRSQSFPQRLATVWNKIQANVEHLGPFRPVLWVHWELEADLFNGDPLVWRCARLAWCGFAAGMLLWLFHELRINRWAALMAGALTMWTPFRNEIWTSLTLAEGVAMPYALLGLIAAIRAGRADHRVSGIVWDVVAIVGVLMALGCKNIFIALLPAQIALRICPDTWNLREGLRRHGWRIVPFLIPIVPFTLHLIYFRMNWHPGQYRPPGPSLVQFVRYMNSLKGAMSLDFAGIGIVLGMIALAVCGAVRSTGRLNSSALVAALLLALGGVAIYLPMDGVAGRYTMPAAWGLDIAVAVLLSAVMQLPSIRWQRTACGAFALGLVMVAIANVGRQEKFAARADMLWQALEWTEQHPLPAGTSVAWISDSASDTRGRNPYNANVTGLNIEEGIHFDWHMIERQQAIRPVVLFDENGQSLSRVEIGSNHPPRPGIIVTAFDQPPADFGEGWEKKQTFEGPYRLGVKRFRCSVWVRGDAASAHAQPSVNKLQ